MNPGDTDVGGNLFVLQDVRVSFAKIGLGRRGNGEGHFPRNFRLPCGLREGSACMLPSELSVLGTLFTVFLTSMPSQTDNMRCDFTRQDRAEEYWMLAAAKVGTGHTVNRSAQSPRKAFAHVGVASTFLLLTLFLGWAGSVAATPSSSAQSDPTRPLPAISNFTLADFDGDRKPDLASVEFNRFDSSKVRYSITVRLTTGDGQTVGVIAPLGGLELAVQDVNGDAALDLIVRTAWQHQLVAIFLNDGHGHFSAADPSAYPVNARETSTAWLSAASELRHDSALSLPGNSAWHYGGGAGLSHPTELGHCAFASVFEYSILFFATSLGRAPPASTSLA